MTLSGSRIIVPPVPEGYTCQEALDAWQCIDTLAARVCSSLPDCVEGLCEDLCSYEQELLQALD